MTLDKSFHEICASSVFVTGLENMCSKALSTLKS